MQVASVSLTRAAAPQEILSWRPETAVSETELDLVRRTQAAEFGGMTRLGLLSLRAYGFGLIAFIGGVLLLLIPDRLTPGRTSAVVVLGAALVLEVWWVAAHYFTRLRHPVERTTAPTHRAEWGDQPPTVDDAVLARFLSPADATTCSHCCSEAPRGQPRTPELPIDESD